MKTDFSCLYFLENEQHVVIEFKRYDRNEKANIADVYPWLMLEKKSGNIQKLAFRSMDSSDEVQERYFDQDYLKFNNQNGSYIEKLNSGQHQLENKTGKALPTEISNALTKYFKA